jgi:hypothetical protein
MNAERNFRPFRALSRLVIRLAIFACVLIAGIAVVGYAAGWIEFRHDTEQKKATIEIEMGQVKEAAEKAVEKARDLVNEDDAEVGEQADKPDGAKRPDAPKPAADDASSPSRDNGP